MVRILKSALVLGFLALGLSGCKKSSNADSAGATTSTGYPLVSIQCGSQACVK